MKKFLQLCAIALSVGLLWAMVVAQDGKPALTKSQDQSPQKDAKGNHAYSGMYSFTQEGEFVQLTVEDDGSITGFISRFGDGEGDKGAFVDQFFKSGTLDSNKLRFTTETVHGVSFDFKGTVERGEGKNPGDEGYFVLKGTLTENSSSTDKKVISRPRDVTLRMFPREASPVGAKG